MKPKKKVIFKKGGENWQIPFVEGPKKRPEGEGSKKWPEGGGPKKWNVRNIMSWGVIVGPIILYLNTYLFGTAAELEETDPMVYVVGGAIGGALAFTAAAAIRNFVVTRRQGGKGD